MTTPIPVVSVDASGISVPAYSDIKSAVEDNFKSIYGSDIYIDPDSQDGQMIAIWALAYSDMCQAAADAFNAFSPTYAQGAGLSSLVKINGLKRMVSSASTATVTIVGQAGTPLNNALIGDDLSLGTQWSIPNGTVIPVGGSISVLATSTKNGDVQVGAGHLTVILTPTAGWQSVTNPADAVAGAPVETDAALRGRQSVSTALPSLSVLDGILAAVGNIPGVLRFTAYENDQASTDSDGVPGHSIAVVVEGGDPIAIATAIATKKTPGTGTYGTTSETVTDAYGIPSTVDFFVLSTVTVSVLVGIHNLSGFTSATEALIQEAIVGFLDALDIGGDSYVNRLWSPANLSGDAATSATGQTQVALDAFSKTYNLLYIYQARSDMVVTGGPYLAGVTVINVTNAADFFNGCSVAVTLDDGSRLLTTATVSGSALTLAAAIPAGRQVNDGALVYLAGDVTVAFDEATESAAADVIVDVS